MTTAYPLEWPAGWPRTPAGMQRNPYTIFDSPGRPLTLDKARRRLFDELARLGTEGIVLSTNVPLRQDGMPRADYARSRIDDPGCAIYFRRDGVQLCMAHDVWLRVDANVNALALAIAGLRQMERHGGAHMMQRAFAGFGALPPPRSWHEILDCGPDASAAYIAQRYRALALTHHPDRGGDPHKMAEINAAYAAAKQLGRVS